VENIVENTSLYLSSAKSCGFSGIFRILGVGMAEFLGLQRAKSALNLLSPATM
jgi:hypothetical protein